MNHMTPEQAQFALDAVDNAVPKPTFAPDVLRFALETIAAMRPEYQYQYPGADPTVNNELGIWHSHPELAHAYRPFNAWLEGRKPNDERGSVVTRYVLDPDPDQSS